jgi:2-hydroxychromene-2-carboxylate isomerase
MNRPLRIKQNFAPAADRVFGVPRFIFEGELYRGHDRIPVLEQRLRASGLALRNA